jgi:hypothetical protein
MSLFVRRKWLAGLLGLSALAAFTFSGFAIGSRDSDGLMAVQDAELLYGSWVGESICQVKESACHDEKALYIVGKSDAPGKVSVTADKIVDGKPVEMGTMDFSYNPKTGVLYAEYKYGAWKFTVKGEKMEGTLTTPDKVVFRRVTLNKQP